MTNKHLTFLVPSLFALAFCTADHAQAALILGTNLIQNAGAEAGVGAAFNNTVVPVPNWTTAGTNFTVIQYTTVPNSQPTPTDPGPASRGLNLFAGGPNPNPNYPAPPLLATGDQVQDVSNLAGLIDSGLVPFTLSAYLGGYLDQRDNATLTAIFEDAALGVLGNTTIGPVSYTDRSSLTGLLFRTASGFIPTGTRNIDFQLVLTGIDGHENDGYADNLSFIATGPNGPAAVPEPGSIAMLALGLCGVGLRLRFGRQKAN